MKNLVHLTYKKPLLYIIIQYIKDQHRSCTVCLLIGFICSVYIQNTYFLLCPLISIAFTFTDFYLHKRTLYLRIYKIALKDKLIKDKLGERQDINQGDYYKWLTLESYKKWHDRHPEILRNESYAFTLMTIFWIIIYVVVILIIR